MSDNEVIYHLHVDKLSYSNACVSASLEKTCSGTKLLFFLFVLIALIPQNSHFKGADASVRVQKPLKVEFVGNGIMSECVACV